MREGIDVDGKVHFSTYVEEDEESGKSRVVCVFQPFDNADMARDFAEWFIADFDSELSQTLH